MFIESLLINPHLVPSAICFFVGLAFLVVAPSLYRIRVKKLIMLNPVEALRKDYSKRERTIYIIGVVLITLGFVSYVIIAKFYGYYYYLNGVPTFLKR